VSDPADAPFPPEEICAQAQSNAAAWILTMIAYLKESGGRSRTAWPTTDAASPRLGKGCAGVRSKRSRTREALIGAMGRALDAVSARDARGFFGHCGYRSVGQPL
jgi:hypothetical protein